jgi:N-acetylglutamate synthase-like GNAT family acetyltransferase
MPGQSHCIGSDATAADDVCLATPADLAYVVALQKRNGEAVGFIPRAALQEKIERRQILLVRENGDPAGFLHHGSLAKPEVRLFQAAIQYDARRRHHGLALVDMMMRRATEAGAKAVSLRCLDFLDANDFWTAAGFRLLGAEPGARGTLNVWGKSIGKVDLSDVSFHSRVHPCPKCGTPTVDTWTRGAVRRRLCARCVARFG